MFLRLRICRENGPGVFRQGAHFALVQEIFHPGLQSFSVFTARVSPQLSPSTLQGSHGIGPATETNHVEGNAKEERRSSRRGGRAPKLAMDATAERPSSGDASDETRALMANMRQ
eukprot:6290537-Prymnesium_polylepis.1